MTKRSYILLFSIILIVKTLVSLYIFHITGNQFFGGGNDSDYYHQYAIGLRDDAVNIWPVLLRWLNNFSLYSRDGVTAMLTFLGILIIPLMTAKLALPKNYIDYQYRKDFWIIAIIVSLYPSLYYQTTDMYRDVFMLLIFLQFLYCCKYISNQYSLLNIPVFLIATILIYILYKFRPYLGAASFLSLICASFYNYKKSSLFFTITIYLGLLIALYHFGQLDRITNSYRSIFDNADGGSNLGIRFTDTLTFLPNFLKSFSYQIMGLYFPNYPSIFIFVSESVFFIFASIYIIRNKKFSTPFINYLIIFFISYATVWLLGNDNLGSAIRLRIFNYIIVLISFFIIKNNKRLHAQNNL